MAYEFSPESFTTFTSDILAANGDQATITYHIGEMADVITSAYAEINRIKDEMKTLESERDRLKDTISRLILCVGAFSDNMVDKGSTVPIREYMDEYFGKVSFKGGYYFKGRSGIFAEYIDYWFNVKTQAKKDGNKGLEKIAKLMLNSLYGKFGARMFGKSKVPVYDNLYDIVRYKTTEVEDRRGGYVPVATFITSYCRDKIIRGANSCGERFIYGDTDSLHIIGTD